MSLNDDWEIIRYIYERAVTKMCGLSQSNTEREQFAVERGKQPSRYGAARSRWATSPVYRFLGCNAIVAGPKRNWKRERAGRWTNIIQQERSQRDRG